MSRFTNQIIKQYARKSDPSQVFSKGNPVGVVLVRPNEDGSYSIGWSQCSNKDRFNRNHGNMIAESRLENDPIVVNPNLSRANEVIQNEAWREETTDAVRRALIQAWHRNEKNLSENS